MVLFIEDEKRIKAMERAEKLAKRTRLGVLTRRLFKIFLVLALLFGVSLLLLSGIKGDSESLKKGAEDYLTQATGLRADIGVFKNMRFFPDLVFEADSIIFYKSGELKKPAMSVEKVQFAAGFFSMMFSQKRFKTLHIKNLRTEEGLLGAHALHIDEIELKNAGFAPGINDPGFYIKGRYGEETIDGFLAMTEEKNAHSLPQKADFTLTLGTLDMAGRIDRNPWHGIGARLSARGFTKDGIVKTSFTLSGSPADPTQIKCALGRFRIKDGIAQSEALYIDTGDGPAAGMGSFAFRTMTATLATDGQLAKVTPTFSLPAREGDHGCPPYEATP